MSDFNFMDELVLEREEDKKYDRLFEVKKAIAIFFEGKRLKAYKDTVGKWTIGIGKNFSDVDFNKDEEAMIRERLNDYDTPIKVLVIENGITEEECDIIFYNTYKIAEQDCKDLVDVYDELDVYRQIALVDFSFNVGKTTMSSFKNTLHYINNFDFDKAHGGFRNSRWFKQVGRRGVYISDIIKYGCFSEDFKSMVKLETGIDINMKRG